MNNRRVGERRIACQNAFNLARVGRMILFALDRSIRDFQG